MHARILILLAFLAGFTACLNQDEPVALAPPPRTAVVVTPEAQAAVAAYVAERSRTSDGLFDLPAGGRTLQLRLVRVHGEYAYRTGPQSRVLCADLADLNGDLYDVDFQLDAGAVAGVMLHRVNGRPFYVWEQNKKGVWRRSPVAWADEGQFNVVRGRDSFEFRYRFQLPEMKAPARLWLPMPQTDLFQTVDVKSASLPGEARVIRDRDYGNRILFVELEPHDSGRMGELVFNVMRREEEPYEPASLDDGGALQPDRLAPLSPRIRAVARQVAGGKRTDLSKARELYYRVMDRLRYWPEGAGGGDGDAVRADSSGIGNAADFHAYFTALARAAGIPARFSAGVIIPADRDGGVIDGSHAWAEFYAERKWRPVDISEADCYVHLANYYFGHLPANRFELSRGRDLRVDPMPVSGPINFLDYPLLEVAGRPVLVPTEFSFQRTDLWKLISQIMRKFGQP